MMLPAIGLKSEEPIAASLARAQAYILGRQSPQGGFCFYRGYYLEEPNLADTWYGLAALALLDVKPRNHPDHVAFVLARPVEPQPFALYYRVRALSVLSVDDPMDAEIRRAVASLQIHPLDPGSTSLSASLQRLRCVLWLKRHFNLPKHAGETVQKLLESESVKGGYGMPPNVLDTEAAIGVLKLCGRAIASRTADFIHGMAEPQFGFRLTAGALSPNLETTCAGVMACSRLGKPIPYAEDTMAFILSCQSGNGGFARTADALPTLALTHMSLATLIVHMGCVRHLQDADA